MRVLVHNYIFDYYCGECEEKNCEVCPFKYRCLVTEELILELNDFGFFRPIHNIENVRNKIINELSLI